MIPQYPQPIRVTQGSLNILYVSTFNSTFFQLFSILLGKWLLWPLECVYVLWPVVHLLNCYELGGKTIHIPTLQKTFDEGGGEQHSFTFKA